MELFSTTQNVTLLVAKKEKYLGPWRSYPGFTEHVRTPAIIEGSGTRGELIVINTYIL